MGQNPGLWLSNCRGRWDFEFWLWLKFGFVLSKKVLVWRRNRAQGFIASFRVSTIILAAGRQGLRVFRLSLSLQFRAFGNGI